MPTRKSVSDANSWGPVDDFLWAANEWHRRCRQICLKYDKCADRYLAMIDTLTTWLAEHPRQARMYWGSEQDCAAPEILIYAATARLHLTTIILQSCSAAPAAKSHRIHLEFLVGIVRQIVCMELHDNPDDYTRLAHKLTGLAALVRNPH